MNIDNSVPHSLFYVQDQKHNDRYFMVDSGSNLCVMPATEADKKNLDDKLMLTGISGTRISTYGERLVSVDLGYSKPIQWVFTIADVPGYVLGIDFIIRNNLALIPCVRSLLNLNDNRSARLLAKTSSFTNPGPLYMSVKSDEDNIPSEAREILKKYPELTEDTGKISPVRHQTVHYIETQGAPISMKPRRLNLTVQEPVKEAIAKMLEEGVIRPSSSPWGSPIHVVPKKSGTWRLVGDYRHLNRVTKKDSYPLPYLRDFSNDLGGKKVFSSIDLKDAFHHIPVSKRDIPKTALSTPYGLFEYCRMPFGLSGAAQTFQRFVDGVFRNLKTPSGRPLSLFVYLDDILVASKDAEQHKEDVETVVRKLAENGLKISPSKCEFFKDKIEFLGHVITPEGLKPQTNKVDSIRNFPLPTTVKGLRRYVGMVNFYHTFVPHLAEILSPVTALLSCPRGVRDQKIKWTEESKKAFEDSKQRLSETTVLNYIIRGAETSVAVDASNYAIAGVLQQRINNEWRPISFFSRKLSVTERKYSTFSKELLAIYASIKAFRHFVEGSEFYVYTDHEPLLKAFPKQSARDQAREERWMEYISLFTKEIRHVKGIENVVADCLSRFLDDQEPTTIEVNCIKNGERVNKDNEKKFSSNSKNLIAEQLYPKIRDYYPKLVVPIMEQTLKLDNKILNNMLDNETYFRNKLFSAYEKVLEKLTEEEIIKLLPLNSATLDNDINEINATQIESPQDNEEFLRALDNDSEILDIIGKNIKFEPKLIKVNGLYYAERSNGKLVLYVPVSLRRKLFDEVHSLGHYGGKASVRLLSSKYVWPQMRKDIVKWVSECVNCKKAKITRHNKAPVEKFPESTGKFNEIHLDLVGPLPPNKGHKYLLTMVDRYTRWVEAIPLQDMTTETVVDAFLLHWIARYGVPRSIVTDRGGQFESHLWDSVMKKLGIDRHRTTAYHPNSNGLVERFHRTLKDGLRAHADDEGQLWLNKLPHMLLAIRNSINPDTEVSPAQSVYGIEPSLPSDVLLPYIEKPEGEVSEYTRELIRSMKFVPSAQSREVSDEGRLDKTLVEATHVLVRRENKRGLQPNYRGPYEVLEKHPKFFKVRLPQGDEYVTIDRLKVCFTVDDYLVEIPNRKKNLELERTLDTVIIRQEAAQEGEKRTEVSVRPKVRTSLPYTGPITDNRHRQSIGERRYNVRREVGSRDRGGRQNVVRENEGNTGTSTSGEQNAPTHRTRSGREVKRPGRFKDFITSPFRGRR